MLEKEFTVIAQQALIDLAALIEDNDSSSLFDVEYADGILTIAVVKTNQNYVINKHSASKKIWYSSPLTGPDYFIYDLISKKWLNNKNKELTEKLTTELKIFK
jgi:frataxin